MSVSSFSMGAFSSSSTGASSSVCCSSSVDLKQDALELCITRIELLVQKVKLGILNGCLRPLNCPITTDFPDDPVLTNCGHIFDRVFIKAWLDRGNPCPVCKTKTTVTQLTPIYALREFVENRLPKDLILTCSNFKGLNQQLAAQGLKMAEIVSMRRIMKEL